MRFSFFFVFLFSVFVVGAQDVLLPIKYNPFQSDQVYLEDYTKSAKVQDHLIFQFDTLDLPFKEDFSKDHFPNLFLDTNDTSISRIKVYRLMENGQPLSSSSRFSYSTSYRVLIDTPNVEVSRTPLQSKVITYVDYSVYPFEESSITVWPAYTIYDTINGGSDTVHFTIPDIQQESATKYLIDKDSTNLWMDSYVYRNNDFPINPPSIGVATFDGLNEHGLPYDFQAEVSGNADKMTSLPIDLSTVDKFTDSVYLSFQYQPQGISYDFPDPEDSLVVDFYNLQTKNWIKVWGTRGFRGKPYFDTVFIAVDTTFFTTAFQFRFRNRAKLSGDFDQWHVDYIHLDKGRSIHDTITKDVTFIYDAPSILKDYHSMPWFHYNINPAVYTKDSLDYCFANRFNQSLSVFYFLEQSNATDSYKYFQYPPSPTFVIVNGSTERCLDYPIEGNPSNFSTTLRSQDFQQEELIECKYSLDFRPGTIQDEDFYPENDTLRAYQEFSNYYAYDDGTAEAGYGIVNVVNSLMLQHYSIPNKDSLTAVQLYFLPQVNDVSKQKFEIVVFDNLNMDDLIYESTQEYQPTYSTTNGFVTYYLDSSIIVQESFYVGVRSLSSLSLGIGFDMNTPNLDKIFISDKANEFRSPRSGIPEGSLMMRPVFREKNEDVGIHEKEIFEGEQINLFPNPTNGDIQVQNAPLNSHLRVFDNMGKLVFEGKNIDRLSLSGQSPGIYFFQWISIYGTSIHSKKVILSSY